MYTPRVVGLSETLPLPYVEHDPFIDGVQDGVAMPGHERTRALVWLSLVQVAEVPRGDERR